MIPTLNDDPEETRKLCGLDSRQSRAGCAVALHCVSSGLQAARQAAHARRNPARARAIALEVGLHYVYEGNISTGNAHTNCPSCNSLLIRRSWHNVLQNNLVVGNPLAPLPDQHRDPPVATARAAATASADLKILSQSKSEQTASGISVAAATHRDSAARMFVSDSDSVSGPCSPDGSSTAQRSESNASTFSERPISALVGEQLLVDFVRVFRDAPISHRPQFSENLLPVLSSLASEIEFAAGRCPHCADAIPGRWLPAIYRLP